MTQLCPKGDYPNCRAIGGRLRSSKEKKTPYAEIKFDVQGLVVYVPLYLSAGAEQYSLAKLTRLGADTSDSENFTFANPEQTLRCEHEEYNGEWKAKWDLAPVFEDTVPPPSSDFARQLNAKLKSRMNQPGKPASAPPKPPAAPPRPPSPPAAPKPVAGPANLEAAYAVLVAAHKTVGNDKWGEACTAVATKTGKEYDAFTPADWQAVVDAYVPF